MVLKISGKDSLETKVIDALQYEFQFNEVVPLNEEINRVQSQLQKQGYFENELISINKESDSIYLAKLHLNKKYDTIYIYTDYKYLPENIIKDIATKINDDYFAIPIVKLETLMFQLNKNMSQKGMPFTSFQLINISKIDNTKLKGQLNITSTKERTIDDIVIKGYEKFPRSFLKRHLSIRKGQILNLDEIKAKCQNLNSLTFSAQIKEPEVLFTSDSTTLYLYLDKTRSNNFDGFLGFGNNENTGKIEFTGYLNLNLINNLNYGESFKLIYRSDENEQRTFNFNSSLPYVLGTPLGLDLNLNIFRRDSTYTIAKQSLKVFYQLNPKNKIFAGIDLVDSNNSSDVTSPILDDYNSTFFNLSYEYLKRTENRLFPLQTNFYLQGGLGRRESDSNDERQTEIKFKAFNIFNLNTKNKIYLNIEGSLLFSDEYLTNELYWFGGINSIRGFEENSIFASLYSILNSEYRYVLNNNLYVHSILDAGYYENQILDLKEKLFGFGFGIGLLTKAGLFRLNYSNGIIENQPFKFNNSKIHISLNASF